MINLTDLIPEERSMIVETMVGAYKQQYTPERLCDLQKIIDAQYFYWWMNDMKYEEWGETLFESEMECWFTGVGEYKSTPMGWARGAKYCNAFLNSAHMGHNPMVWFMDDTHARGIFLLESNMNYRDNGKLHEHVIIYVDDFVKRPDGQWGISAYRLMQTKLQGDLMPERVTPPEDYVMPESVPMP